MHSERVRGDGFDLHVVRGGFGTAVILLRFPENWRSWRHQIGAIAAAGFSVWAPDLRGYNLSDRPVGCDANHLRHLIKDVAAVVHATGQESAYIIGHDWGGVIAWTFAGRYPELTRKLIILNAPHMRIYLRRVRRPPQIFQSWYVLLFQLPWVPERVLSAANFYAVRHMFTRLPARRGVFSQGDIQRYVEALSEPCALTGA